MSEVVSWRDESPGVRVVTMDRPPANALGVPILDGLHAAIDAAERDGNVKVMVVCSALDGFFAAGADIKHLSSADADSFLAYGNQMRAVNDRLAAAPWISVAAVDGLALGGGLELALACTLRVSGPRGRFGLPEVKLGLIPGAGGTQRLPRLVGRGRALDIMLTARQVPPDEALSMGLIDRITEGDTLKEALALAGELHLTPAQTPRPKRGGREPVAAMGEDGEMTFGDSPLPRASARSLLLTVMGEFAYDEGAVWTTALLKILAGLGIEEHAARQAIARSAAAGWIESERQGRAVRWRLTEQGRAVVTDGQRRSEEFMTPSAPWDGRWLVLLVSLPQNE